MPILVFLPNLDMGGSDMAITRMRSFCVANVPLTLSAGDVVTLKVQKVSGTPTIKLIASGSSLTLEGK